MEIVTNNQSSLISFREKFECKLDEYERENQGAQRKRWTQEKVLEVINKIRNARVTMSKGETRTGMDYYWSSKYDIMIIANEEHLIFKRTSPNDPTVHIIPKNEYFSILEDTHKSCGHGGRDKMLNAIKTRYYIPKKAVEIFVSLCPTCETKKVLPKKGIVTKPIVTQDFNNRGKVNLMDFQSCADGEYKWLLNYQDNASKYVSLQPLKTKRAQEVAIKEFVSEELPLETSFKCTECYSFSIGPMVTCVQCSDITICLKCDREGRHQFHCLLKMPKKQYMDAVKDYLSKVREMFARLLINFKDEEEKQKTELMKKETRKAKKTKAKVKKIPTTTLQKQKTSISNSPHRKTTSEDTEGSKQLVKKIKENTNQQQPDTKQPKIEMIGPSASSQENDFVIQPTSSSNVAFQTCGAPQVNVPALTPGVISTSTPSTAADEAGDQLALPAKRTADDVECEKRLAVKGIKVEIKEEEMYEVEILDESMMVVGDVKTEPPEELTTEIDPVAVIRTEKNS